MLYKVCSVKIEVKVGTMCEHRHYGAGTLQSCHIYTWRKTCENHAPHTHGSTQLTTTAFQLQAKRCQQHDSHKHNHQTHRDIHSGRTRGPAKQVLPTVPQKPIQGPRPQPPQAQWIKTFCHQNRLQVVHSPQGCCMCNQWPHEDPPDQGDSRDTGVLPPPPQAPGIPRASSLTARQCEYLLPLITPSIHAMKVLACQADGW